VLAVRVPDLGAREALIASDPQVFFTIPHFADYPAVLVLLEVIALPDLDECLVEAWLDRAPVTLASAYLDAHPR
jgi:hypothetical protein